MIFTSALFLLCPASKRYESFFYLLLIGTTKDIVSLIIERQMVNLTVYLYKTLAKLSFTGLKLLH